MSRPRRSVDHQSLSKIGRQLGSCITFGASCISPDHLGERPLRDPRNNVACCQRPYIRSSHVRGGSPLQGPSQVRSQVGDMTLFPSIFAHCIGCIYPSLHCRFSNPYVDKTFRVGFCSSVPKWPTRTLHVTVVLVNYYFRDEHALVRFTKSSSVKIDSTRPI